MRIRRSIAGAALAFLVLGAGVGAFALGDPADALGGDRGPEVDFEEVNASTGLEYRATRDTTHGNSRAGVYVADYNNDDFPDVLAIGGDRPVLFENADGTFERSDALPAVEFAVHAALFFDYDNDGWTDLLLFRPYGSPVFFENRRGAFARREVGLGEANFSVPTAASAADYDGDGCLDLLVVQNGDWRTEIPRKERMAARQQSDESTLPANVAVEEDNGAPNRLFRGDCEEFEEVSEDAGIGGERWSLAASFTDLTGNGLPDIHVANDYNYDYVYVNEGGTFRERKVGRTNRHGMSSEVADFNGDGRMDIFVTNIRFETEKPIERSFDSLNTRGNNLLVNRGDGRFVSREAAYGVSVGGWGWAAAAEDLDNDGDLDLVHATQVYANETVNGVRTETVRTYPRVWSGENRTFRPLNASEVGLKPSDGRGMAALDFDRDGDRDLVVADPGGRFKLYENRGASGGWVQISVRGTDRVPALGADVTVRADGATSHRVVNARADFWSQDSRTLHVGVGNAETVSVRVEWTDGTTRTFEDVPVDERVAVSPNGTASSVPP